MIRLNMIVEGQTEEAFVHAVLEEHLAQHEVFVSVRCVETSHDRERRRRHRGGLKSFAKAEGDLQRWMKEDQGPEAWFTTTFDLYRLPSRFPGRAEAARLNAAIDRVNLLEARFLQKLGHQRFVPYFQLHEFEALLFADPAQFDWEFIDHASAIGHLVKIAAGFQSPEEINETEHGAPSKRIIHEIPEYESRKVIAAPVIAGKIGLAALRAKCPHFDEWITRLEQLA